MRYVVIGAQAVIRHGHVRATEDVDVTLVAAAFDQGERVIQLLTDIGLQSIVDDPAAFVRLASVHRCVEPVTGYGVDISFVDSPYLKQALERVMVVETDGHPVPYLGLEDLLIHKTVAGRPHDQTDAVELMARYPDFDAAYVERWLAEFEQLLEQPMIEVFRAWRDEALG